MKLHTLPVFLIVAVLLGLSGGCVKQRAAGYFDRVISGQAPYELGGVSGYEVRAYQIVQTVGDLVVVKVTYGTVAGLDRQLTKRYRLVGGRLRPIDADDIRDQVLRNLQRHVALALDRAMIGEAGALPPKIDYDWLVKNSLLKPEELEPAAGENYNTMRIFLNPKQGMNYRIEMGPIYGSPVVYEE